MQHYSGFQMIVADCQRKTRYLVEIKSRDIRGRRLFSLIFSPCVSETEGMLSDYNTFLKIYMITARQGENVRYI